MGTCTENHTQIVEWFIHSSYWLKQKMNFIHREGNPPRKNKVHERTKSLIWLFICFYNLFNFPVFWLISLSLNNNYCRTCSTHLLSFSSFITTPMYKVFSIPSLHAQPSYTWPPGCYMSMLCTVFGMRWDSNSSVISNNHLMLGTWDVAVFIQVGSLPGVLLFLPFPLAAWGKTSTSPCGIWATFCKKIFSKARAISTMSSVG